MIRTLACFLGLNWATSGLGEAAEYSHDARARLRGDALGEYLRGSSHDDVLPEVLLRIL